MMQVLIGWDDESEARSIRDLLGGHGIDGLVATNRQTLEDAAGRLAFDAILLALKYVREDSGALFENLKALQPETEFLVASFEEEHRRFASLGSDERVFHFLRDVHGDFILLLPTLFRAACDTKDSRWSRRAAERVREMIEQLRENTDPASRVCLSSLLEEINAVLHERDARWMSSGPGHASQN